MTTTLPSIDLGDEQHDGVKRVVDWFQSDQQVFRLFGYAGTGKTTLARHIVDQLGITALFAAFTGKAAYVLRTKGCDDAGTVHGLIYQPKERARAHLDKLRRQLDNLLDQADDPIQVATLQREIQMEERKLENPDFILRDDSRLAEAPLLVLDEVSMIGHKIAGDLLSFRTKMLVLGDPAQLPPVDGGGYFINAAPDHLLTEIHRSALDSPVTRLATAVRNSAPGDRRYGVTGTDGDSGRMGQLAADDLLSFDQVLVGKNATRWAMVHLLRALRGVTDPAPVPGDRIITLANSGEAEVFNGQQFDVIERLPSEHDDQYSLRVVDDEGCTRELTVWTWGFVDLNGEKAAKRVGRNKVAAATFAQAVTVHKAQGSQWDKVLVVDESYVFYGAAYREHAAALGPAAAAIEGHVNARRWLYTAITRAAKQVVIIPAGSGGPA